MDVNTIKRIIFRLFPEMTGRWHLPRWGKVVALPELPEEGDLSDRFYPHYAVDVQLLDEKGIEYQDKPPLQAVPLPVPGLGDHAGRLEPPAIGSIVELGFMFGQPDKPFIRCVLPLGFKLPAIKEGESRHQQRQGVYHLVDQGGNFENKTDQNLKDIIGKLAQLECETRKVIASKEQDHRSPKSWFGSEEENVLRLLSELMQVVAGLAGTCATHTHPIGTHHDVSHGNSGPPAAAGDFEGQGTSCTQLKARLDPITK